MEVGDDKYVFIKDLPGSCRQHDSIWIIVYQTTKSTYFLPIISTHSTGDYAKLYTQELVILHGVPVSIILDRDSQFMIKFLKSFQNGLGSKVNLSNIFHPCDDSQAESTIQTLEYMLIS